MSRRLSDSQLTPISETLIELEIETIRSLLHDGEQHLDQARARYDLAWQLLASLAVRLPKPAPKSNR